MNTMHLPVLYLTLFVSLFLGFAFGEVEKKVSLQENDRVLILAPHPDDESIGTGGIIQEAIAKKNPIKVVYYTNGDSNELAFIVYEKKLLFNRKDFLKMGEVRRKEAINAMDVLGLEQENLVFLGYPDFGTMHIFTQYWGDTKPFKSLLTKVRKVPYPECLSPKAPYVGESILKDLKTVITDFKPTKIFVTSPVDYNRDHRSLYLFLRVVLWDLEGTITMPEVICYLVHCLEWPMPRGCYPNLSLDPPKVLKDSDIVWKEYNLDPEQIRKKHDAIMCYKSQNEYNPLYLLSFARKNELFGNYPEIIVENNDTYEVVDGDVIQLNGLIEPEEHIESASCAKRNGNLYFKIKIKKMRHDFKGLELYLFGYRKNTPFSGMPKIRISVQNDRDVVIHDKRKSVRAEGYYYIMRGNDIYLKVPLSGLGNPEYILASGRTYKGVLPYYTTSWRVLEIGQKTSVSQPSDLIKGEKNE